jgi:hypothetical protein
MNTIRAIFSKGNVRLFRQQVGMAWTGDVHHLRDGSVLINNPRPFHAGFEGLSDLGGWVSVMVTPEMVGRKLAVYVALEVKAPRGRPTTAQLRFIDAVTEAGGIAAVVRSEHSAAMALAGPENIFAKTVDNGLTTCSHDCAGDVPASNGE